MQFSCDISILFELYTYANIHAYRKMSREANNEGLQKALSPWRIDYIVRLILYTISSLIFERTIWIVSFRLGIFRRTISNSPSKNSQKISSIRPDTLDDRWDGTMPTLPNFT